MPRYALKIEYDGGPPSCGWQWQDAHPSVQGALQAAVARIAPEAPPVAGAGRTDGGVHALGQVAHVDLARAWEPFRLTAAINAHLRPARVAVVAAARGRRRLPRPLRRGRARVSLPGGRAAGAAGARPRARLAGRACARPRGDAGGRGGTGRAARLHHLPLVDLPGEEPGPDARRARDRGARRPAGASTASGCGRGRSCTTRCAASSARSSGSAPAPGRRSGSARRSRRATGRPAARSARPTASTSSRCATREDPFVRLSPVLPDPWLVRPRRGRRAGGGRPAGARRRRAGRPARAPRTPGRWRAGSGPGPGAGRRRTRPRRPSRRDRWRGPSPFSTRRPRCPR